MNRSVIGITAATVLMVASFTYAAEVSFFITSAGPGKGADLGGLAGADAHCQKLAETAGGQNHTWRAYLSIGAVGDSPAVNARDRIGKGPWHNVKGVMVAKDVDELHGENNLTKETVLTEGGAIVNGRGDRPNRHDILTSMALHWMRIVPVKTGRVVAMEPRPWVTMIEPGEGPIRLHGILRTELGVVVSPIYRVRVVMDCFIVLPSANDFS